MSILVFGRGFVGTRLGRDLPDAKLLPTDITDRAAVLAAIREHKPTAVVNAAGKTGMPNVDWCETHQPETFRGNVQGPLTLADAGGGAGATGFLREDGRESADMGWEPVMRHLDHLLSRLGEGGVALGSDFDGATVPQGITDVAGLPNLIQAMRAHGYGER